MPCCSTRPATPTSSTAQACPWWRRPGWRGGGSTAETTDRALGALYGLAIGDALGMPTQELSRAASLRVLGPKADFRAGPEENPISRGLPAGSVTDDTLQSLLVAR